MVRDEQVRQLQRCMAEGIPLYRAAWKTGMSLKTARKYHRVQRLPSEVAAKHTWRTRHDSFESVWLLVEEKLHKSPRLQAKVLFEWLQREYPGQFDDGQLRTFQRRVKQWRAIHGPPKEVFFRQNHRPGELAASDFTDASDLNVTVAGECHQHKLFHFVLTYSNWESVTLCASEDFESFSDGLENALWSLSGVPARHRSDSFAAATCTIEEVIDFGRRHRLLMQHYRMKSETIGAGRPHENGDVEASHRHLKEAIEQALILRGSREFSTRSDYVEFLQQIVDQRNTPRQKRLNEELAALRPLPSRRLDSYERVQTKVDTGSLIHINGNAYSVDSRMIGERVEVRVYVERIEVWYANECRDSLPCLQGRGGHHINYRHVIDSLIRKPRAFENYRYRTDLFPTDNFRQAYEQLKDFHPQQLAAKEYLQILQMAARTDESLVDRVLNEHLDSKEPVNAAAIIADVDLRSRSGNSN